MRQASSISPTAPSSGEPRPRHGRGHRGRSLEQSVVGRWFRWDPKFTSNNLGSKADASCTRAPSIPWSRSRRAGHHRVSGLGSRLWLSKANRGCSGDQGACPESRPHDCSENSTAKRNSFSWSHGTQQGTQQMHSLCLGRHRSRDRTSGGVSSLTDELELWG